MKSKIAISLTVLGIIWTALFQGCASTGTSTLKLTPAQQAALSSAAQVIGQDAATMLVTAAQNEVSANLTKKASVNSVSSALWSTAGTLISSGALSNTITAFSSVPLPQTAKTAVAVFNTAAPATPAASTAVTAAIATAISAGAGSPPTP